MGGGGGGQGLGERGAFEIHCRCFINPNEGFHNTEFLFVFVFPQKSLTDYYKIYNGCPWIRRRYTRTKIEVLVPLILCIWQQCCLQDCIRPLRSSYAEHYFPRYRHGTNIPEKNKYMYKNFILLEYGESFNDRHTVHSTSCCAKYKRTKIALYSSPDCQINRTFDSGAEVQN